MKWTLCGCLFTAIQWPNTVINFSCNNLDNFCMWNEHKSHGNGISCVSFTYNPENISVPGMYLWICKIKIKLWPLCTTKKGQIYKRASKSHAKMVKTNWLVWNERHECIRELKKVKKRDKHSLNKICVFRGYIQIRTSDVTQQCAFLRLFQRQREHRNIKPSGWGQLGVDLTTEAGKGSMCI